MMNAPIWLTDFQLKKASGLYWHMMRSEGKRVDWRTDANLGCIATGFSENLKELIHMIDPTFAITPTQLLASDITLTNYELVPLKVWPWRWALTMEQNQFKFTVNLDSNLECVLAGYSAALKFFAVKNGDAVLFPEVIRQKDVAIEQGFMKDDIERLPS
jgi:hypothetical protein